MSSLRRQSITIQELPSVEKAFIHLGGYSRYQLWATLIVITPEVPAAMFSMLPVIIGAQRVPESQSTTNNTNNSKWTGFEFDIFSPNFYERGTVTEEWGLYGSLAWVPDTFTSIFMLGMMMGAVGVSQWADKYGRKKIQYMNILLMTVCGIGCALAPNPYFYAAMRFMVGIGDGGFYCVYSIFLMEFLTPKWRFICGSFSIWFMGVMILSLLGYLIRSWRLLTLVTSLISAGVLLTYPLITETPRWLLCKNKTKQAQLALRIMARVNGKQELSQQFIENLQKSVILEQEKLEESERDSSISMLWKSSKLRTPISAFMVMFFTIGTVYFGISYNAKNLSGDPYLNIFYLGVVDMVSFPIGALFSNRFGRKRVTGFFFLLGAVFLLMLIIAQSFTHLTETYIYLETCLGFMGRFGLSAGWGVALCYAGETFPTVIRSTAVGVLCLVAYIGGIVAPQASLLTLLCPSGPYMLFFVLMVSTVISITFLSDMKGKPLENF